MITLLKYLFGILWFAFLALWVMTVITSGEFPLDACAAMLACLALYEVYKVQERQ